MRYTIVDLFQHALSEGNLHIIPFTAKNLVVIR